MAQARQAPPPEAMGGGAPRTNKTVKQFGGMNTQNQRNAVPEGQFAWLENIQPIGPGNLHSIPGRGLSLVTIPPVVTCPDNFPFLPQSFVQDGYFDNAYSNARTSWGYISPEEEVTVFIIDLSTGSPYDSFFRHHTDIDTTIETFLSPFAVTNLYVGNSDEQSFLYSTGANSFYNEIIDAESNSQIGHTCPTPGKNWCKHGDRILIQDTSFGFAGRLREFDLSTEPASLIAIRDNFQVAGNLIQKISATTTYWYVLYSDAAAAALKVAQIRRSDFSVTATFNMTAAGAGSVKAIAVVDDTIFWWIQAGTTPTKVKFGHVQDMTTLTVILDEVSYAPLTNNFGLAGTMNLVFQNRFLYWGDDGADGSVHIYRFGPLVCPS
jgi:hypothetical protein